MIFQDKNEWPERYYNKILNVEELRIRRFTIKLSVKEIEQIEVYREGKHDLSNYYWNKLVYCEDGSLHELWSIRTVEITTKLKKPKDPRWWSIPKIKKKKKKKSRTVEITTKLKKPKEPRWLKRLTKQRMDGMKYLKSKKKFKRCKNKKGSHMRRFKH